MHGAPHRPIAAWRKIGPSASPRCIPDLGAGVGEQHRGVHVGGVDQFDTTADYRGLDGSGVHADQHHGPGAGKGRLEGREILALAIAAGDQHDLTAQAFEEATVAPTLVPLESS